MQIEIAPINHNNAIHENNRCSAVPLLPNRLASTTPYPVKHVLEGTTRAALANYLELLLNNLRGEALLVAALAYGLRVPISSLRELRIRDISITERLVFIASRERQIPHAIVEDLREHLFENVCGREASIGVTNRADRLFSQSAFEQLTETAQSIQSLLAEQLQGIARRRSFSYLDTQLKLLGALHAKRMRRAGRLTPCPLDSINKGPRIVRRGRGGAIDAYYRWRLNPNIS
jgi:hypothetical protein